MTDDAPAAIECNAKTFVLKRTFKFETEMHQIGVTPVFGGARVEEQSFLKRSQWPDVFEIGQLTFDELDLVLREVDSDQVSRCQSARAFSDAWCTKAPRLRNHASARASASLRSIRDGANRHTECICGPASLSII